MASTRSDKVVVSYYDVALRPSDIALLEGPHWLNDAIIGFEFYYLDNKYNKPGTKEYCFISPEVTQLLKMSKPSFYCSFLDPSSVGECRCIFFPLNNCDRKDAAGGSHWSLLVYSREDKMCYHFDSARGLNSEVAAEFARNVVSCVLEKDDVEKVIVEEDCPQQDNGYDCGIYVLCIADVIVKHVMKTETVEGCDFSGIKKLTQLKRSQLLDVITELKHAADRCR